MVITGQWPYTHLHTLMRLRELGIANLYYNVDIDTIVSEDDADQLLSSGWQKDDINLIVASDPVFHAIECQNRQLFPPEIPEDIQRLINSNTPTYIKQSLDDVSSVAPVAIIRGQSKDVMNDLGFKYNESLGVWIGHIEGLQSIREKKRQLNNGKIEHRHYMGQQHCIYGDTLLYTEELKDAGAIWHDTEQVWYIDASQIGKVAHIFT